MFLTLISCGEVQNNKAEMNDDFQYFRDISPNVECIYKKNGFTPNLKY